jgi:hypothetical protein
MNKVSKIEGAWIWFWYNNITRIFFVMVPTYFVVLIPLLMYFGLQGEALRQTVMITYIAVFMIAMMDNNYENLNKIGLDVNRRKIESKKITLSKGD